VTNAKRKRGALASMTSCENPMRFLNWFRVLRAFCKSEERSLEQNEFGAAGALCFRETNVDQSGMAKFGLK
jgi:hypothetical protein